jgi:UDP-glucose 4-epimerase
MTAKKICVTGAAGFIGRHLCAELLHRGHEIIAIDNYRRSSETDIAHLLKNDRFHFWFGDVRSYDQLRQLMDGAEVVYHLAAQSSVMTAEDTRDYTFETNVIGTFNVLKAAASNAVSRVIFTSSREVYGEVSHLPVAESQAFNAKNAYGISKAAGEQYCRLFHNREGVDTVVFRLANVYGNGDRDRVIPIFLQRIANGEAIEIYGGDQVIDFISVRKVAEVLIAAMEMDAIGDYPINVGSGRGTTLMALANKMQSLHNGKSVRIEKLPSRDAEVRKFTADISRFKSLFDIEIPDDPLYDLPGVFAK